MRRLVSLTGIIVLVALAMTIAPPLTEGQFATNTPSAAEADDETAATEPATDDSDTASTGGSLFATNTPAGPTDIPTTTPSPTATLTATATPSATPTVTNTPTNTPTPTPTPIGPFSYPDGINPLTGLPYPNDEAANRRNLIVKISNFPPIVRPQHGLNSADVVYEYEAEGGVTRFAAIFRSVAPERVGSVRSARLMDIDLSIMYQALLAYSGTSEPIQQLLLDNENLDFKLVSPIVGVEESQSNNCESSVFCRNTSLDVPREHTLFGNAQLMWDEATRRNINTGYKAFGFAFGEDPDPNGIPANDVFIEWWGQTNARWQYDEDTRRYYRYTEGVPHYDAATGEQVWVDNLVILQVEHKRRPDLFPEGATYESLDVDLVGQNVAYLIRDGQSYDGYWRRRDEELGSALQIIYGDNTPIKMKPGRTWVTVVRGLGNATLNEELVDTEATATVIAQTPTATPFDPNPDS